MTSHDTVLVVGAGPTGLTTACTLLQHGVDCRIVDRRKGPASEPKALILWSGALEALRRVGVADGLVEQALPLSGASYWSKGRAVGRVRFGALAGTAFPRPLCLRQTATEQLLHDRLTELGGKVEWDTELIDAQVLGRGTGARVSATLSAAGTSTAVSPRWLVGADGTHSTVREVAAIPFEGSTYPRDFLLGDGEFDGDLPADEAQYHLTSEGVLVVVPLPGGGHRVFFDRDATGAALPPSQDDLQALLTARGRKGWRLRSTWWRSNFRVHTKVAAAFRAGPVLLAGDAAHCHSPAGGQGLNTGVQDGFSLGWKLAAIGHGADPALLDGYEIERRPAALRALRNSDRQTRLWMLRDGPRRVLRDTVLRVASATGALDRTIVPQLAQLDPGIEDGPEVSGRIGSDGRTGASAIKQLRPGGRLPDMPWRALTGTTAPTLHTFLAAGRHVLLVLSDGSQPARDTATAGRVADLAAAAPVSAQTDVLMLTHAAPPDHGLLATAGCARAVDTGGVLTAKAGPEATVVYVRPDGAVGAWAAPDALPQLASAVGVLSPGAPVERAA